MFWRLKYFRQNCWRSNAFASLSMLVLLGCCLKVKLNPLKNNIETHITLTTEQSLYLNFANIQNIYFNGWYRGRQLSILFDIQLCFFFLDLIIRRIATHVRATTRRHTCIPQIMHTLVLIEHMSYL